MSSYCRNICTHNDVPIYYNNMMVPYATESVMQLPTFEGLSDVNVYYYCIATYTSI